MEGVSSGFCLDLRLGPLSSPASSFHGWPCKPFYSLNVTLQLHATAHATFALRIAPFRVKACSDENRGVAGDEWCEEALPLEPPAKNNGQFAIFPGPNTTSTCNSATQGLRFLALTYSPGKRRQQLYSSSSLGGNDGVTTSSTTQRTKRISNNWLWIP